MKLPKLELANPRPEKAWSRPDIEPETRVQQVRRPEIKQKFEEKPLEGLCIRTNKSLRIVQHMVIDASYAPIFYR